MLAMHRNWSVLHLLIVFISLFFHLYNNVECLHASSYNMPSDSKALYFFPLEFQSPCTSIIFLSLHNFFQVTTYQIPCCIYFKRNNCLSKDSSDFLFSFSLSLALFLVLFFSFSSITFKSEKV